MENRLSGLTSLRHTNLGWKIYCPSISQELFDSLKKWRTMTSNKGYILRSINRHGHIGKNLHPANISTLSKALQKCLNMDSDEQPLSGHSFRVEAAIDLLQQGEPLERIILRG